jgi:hypothetical protein
MVPSTEWIEFIIVAVLLWLLMTVAISELELRTVVWGQSDDGIRDNAGDNMPHIPRAFIANCATISATDLEATEEMKLASLVSARCTLPLSVAGA